MKNIIESSEFKKIRRERRHENIILGVDIDGVQNNFIDGFFDVYQKYFPDKEFNRDVVEWDFHLDLDLDGADPDEYFVNTKAEVFQYSEPYSGVLETMEKIYGWCVDNNITMKIVTSQPTEDSKQGAIEWLAKYNIPYDDIVFSRSSQKFEHCNILIDDSESVLNSKPENKVSIKVNRNWNKGVQSDFEVAELKEVTIQLLNESLDLLHSRN